MWLRSCFSFWRAGCVRGDARRGVERKSEKKKKNKKTRHLPEIGCKGKERNGMESLGVWIGKVVFIQRWLGGAKLRLFRPGGGGKKK